MTDSVTHTAIEDEYREAIEKYGEEAAFKELKKLYNHEENRIND